MTRAILLTIACGLLLAATVYVSVVIVKGRKAALALVFGPIQRRPVDFARLRLKDTPNQYLVCPESFCGEAPHAAAPIFAAPAADLQAAWFELIAGEKASTVIARDEPNRQFDIETLTPLVGFPDTATVRVIELPDGGSTLAVYSRSHYGHSDLGANKNRVDEWLNQLTARLGENG